MAGLKVTVNFSGDLASGSCPITSAWTIDIDGTDFTPGSARCETRSVLLWLHRNSAPGIAHTYKVSYDKTKASFTGGGLTLGGPLKGAGTGNPEVASFTDQAVTNPNPGSPYVPPGPPQPDPWRWVDVNATVNGKTLTVGLPIPVDESSVPAASAFRVSTFHGGGTGIRDCRGFCTVAVSAVSLSGQVLTLTLDEVIPHGAETWLRYTRPSANPLREPSGGRTLRFDRERVTVETPDKAPVFSRAALTPSADGASRYVYVVFNELLDEDAEPAGSAFTVTARPPGGRARTVRGTGTVNVIGSLVAVELASPVAHGSIVTVRYVKPSANPLRDRAGKRVESFSGKPVTAGKPSIVSVALSSDPGRDRTYGLGDTVRVQVTFSGPVFVTGRPRQQLSMGQSNWQRSPARGGYYHPWADYESGSGTPTLTFAYTVKELDRTYTGLSVWHNLDLNGGKISALVPWTYPRYEADVSHDWLPYDARHKVDGGLPSFRSAAVDGKALTVSFNGNLDPASVPAPGAFRVTVNGARRAVAAGGVAISGADVRLTLTSAVSHTDTVKVRYTKPSTKPLQSGSGTAVNTFADQSVTNDTGVGVWSATLTVKSFNLGTYLGCANSDAAASCAAGLTSDSFEHGGETYRITQVVGVPTGPTTGVLFVDLDKAWPGAFRDTVTLHIGTEQFSLSNGTFLSSNTRVRWSTGRNLSGFSENAKVGLRLAAVPEPRPSFRSAAVDWKALTVTFNGNLDRGSVPAPGAFHVTVNGARRSVAAGGVAISGADVRLTLASAVAHGDTVRVRYTRPSTKPVQGIYGAAVETFPDEAVTNNTQVSVWSATLTVKSFNLGTYLGCANSDAAASCAAGLTSDSFEHGGETYRITQVVGVPTGPTTGVLFVDLDKAWPGAFRDTVTLHIGTEQFSLSNGTFLSSNTRVRWSTGRNLSGFSENAKVDLRLTTASDSSGDAGGDSGGADSVSVTEVSVVSGAGPDKTYALGEIINVRVTFSETVDVTGTPRLKIDMDPAHWGEKWAAYASGSGTSSLTFAHEVVEPNISTQGIAVLANTLELNGGTIRSGGADADLAHDGLAHDANHKVDWQLEPEEEDGGASGDSDPGGHSVDSGPPSVTAVAVVSDPGTDKTYLLGDKIRIRATFSAAVTVTGTPGLKIDMDPAHWGTKRAAYESGSGTRNLTFAHTVVEPNYSSQGIAVLANTLALGGGTIRSSSGTNAALAHSGLGHDANHKVDWRPEISVADAQANEGAGSISFEVSLSRAFTSAEHSVTLDYATADGTATAGEETFSLRLSNATGGRIGDGEATGTISNDDPLQKMWLSRFGRTVADHVTGAVSDRLSGPLTGAQVTVGGERVDLARTDDEAWLGQTLTSLARVLGAAEEPVPEDGPGAGSGARNWPETGIGAGESRALAGSPARDVSGRELLLGSAFHLAREGDGDGPGLAAWGRVTVGGFDGEAPADSGNVRIDGDVTTGILGADAAWDRLLAGVAVSVSEGEGTFAQPGVDAGAIESTMTTVSPYARLALTDRISTWGLAGFGTGDMTIVQAANDATGQPERVSRTDLSMRLGALGGRGALLTADEAGGFDLALKADGFYVETTSEAVSNEGDTTADASRVRLILEGSRAFETGGGAVLTPGLELGLRHDGGDAETGTGVELGGRIAWSDPGTGLGMEARVRTLVAHEDSGYEEWGASGSIRLEPGASGRGLSFRLAPTWGAASSGVERLWSAQDARGLAPGGEFEPEHRFEGELGYGLPVFGGAFTGTPNAGFALSDRAREVRVGWRLTSAARGHSGFEVSLDATRREAAGDSGPSAAAGSEPEHGVMLRGSLRW